MRQEVLLIRRNVKLDSVTRFLVYCVEIFKTSQKINGKQVIEIFSRYKVFEYIVEFYGALHTTGTEYIIEDISGFIEEQKSDR